MGFSSFSPLLDQMSLRGWSLGVTLLRWAARLLALAGNPSSYSGTRGVRVAACLVRVTWPALWWYAGLTLFFGQTLVQMVLGLAEDYGLKDYALTVVVRVWILELVPWTAALFVLLRVLLVEVDRPYVWRRGGAALGSVRQFGSRLLRVYALPRLLGGVGAVVLLTQVGCLIAWILIYVNFYGFSPWAWSAYIRWVGDIFTPVVVLIFLLKVFVFALVVGLTPLVLMLDRGVGRDVRILIGVAAVLLLLELLALLFLYY